MNKKTEQSLFEGQERTEATDYESVDGHSGPEQATSAGHAERVLEAIKAYGRRRPSRGHRRRSGTSRGGLTPRAARPHPKLSELSLITFLPQNILRKQ